MPPGGNATGPSVATCGICSAKATSSAYVASTDFTSWRIGRSIPSNFRRLSSIRNTNCTKFATAPVSRNG